MLKSMALNQRQEIFCLNLFQGMTQREAWIQAGYSNRYKVAWIDSHACNLARQAKIQARLAELRDEVKAALVKNTIATVEERKERLTEILRARLPDYQTENGIHIDTDSPNTGAIESFETYSLQPRDSHAGKIAIKRPVVPESLRNKIFEHDGHKCRQCGATDDLQLDHIVPLSRGGETVEKNLQTLCETCNKQKAGGKKSQAVKVTKIKLHSPIAAIAELNKMESIYSEQPPIADNRTYNILVADSETKEAVLRLIGGGKRGST